jgi:hypothetical protein
MQYDDEDDIEQWYADGLAEMARHANQLQSLLLARFKEEQRNNYSRSVGLEHGYGKPKAGQLAKISRCLNHATKVAEAANKLSVNDIFGGKHNPEDKKSMLSSVGLALLFIGGLILLIGILVMLASVWPGVVTAIVGIIIFIIGIVLYVCAASGSKQEKKYWVAIAVSITGFAILLLAFIILLVVLT